jgi:hypothetical protein
MMCDSLRGLAAMQQEICGSAKALMEMDQPVNQPLRGPPSLSPLFRAVSGGPSMRG